MQEQPYREDKDELSELLRKYTNLRKGLSHSFLTNADFEKIIDYYDDHDDLKRAIAAAETGLEYFPYSAQLLIKKADLFIATRKYAEALQLLEQASLFDASNINLYILKTDAFLALDEQQKD